MNYTDAKQAVDPIGEEFLNTLLGPRGILIGQRVISPGDEDALFEAEAAAIGKSALKVRRQSGAARIAAREIIRALGRGEVAIPRSGSGAPLWPQGLVGSLAHDDTVALAALASAREFTGLGIDVEPAVPLPSELIELVATPAERSRYGAAPLAGRVLFAVKEAIYKARNQIDGLFLDFQDIEVELETNRGLTRNGHTVAIAVATSPSIVALAFVRAPSENKPSGWPVA